MHGVVTMERSYPATFVKSKVKSPQEVLEPLKFSFPTHRVSVCYYFRWLLYRLAAPTGSTAGMKGVNSVFDVTLDCIRSAVSC